jgi:hypothetical protein
MSSMDQSSNSSILFEEPDDDDFRASGKNWKLAKGMGSELEIWCSWFCQWYSIVDDLFLHFFIFTHFADEIDAVGDIFVWKQDLDPVFTVSKRAVEERRGNSGKHFCVCKKSGTGRGKMGSLIPSSGWMWQATTRNWMLQNTYWQTTGFEGNKTAEWNWL